MKKSELMSRAKLGRHQGKMILSLNFSNLSIDDAQAVITYSSGMIEKMPKKSIYTLTDITAANFDQALIDALKSFASRNKPHVVAGAVVGAEGLKKVLFNTILKFSGRDNMRLFADENSALEWLATQQ